MIGWWQQRVPPMATPIVSGGLCVIVNDPLCALHSRQCQRQRQHQECSMCAEGENVSRRSRVTSRVHPEARLTHLAQAKQPSIVVQQPILSH